MSFFEFYLFYPNKILEVFYLKFTELLIISQRENIFLCDVLKMGSFTTPGTFVILSLKDTHYLLFCIASFFVVVDGFFAHWRLMHTQGCKIFTRFSEMIFHILYLQKKTCHFWLFLMFCS